jgi:hypothetical protein
VGCWVHGRRLFCPGNTQHALTCQLGVRHSYNQAFVKSIAKASRTSATHRDCEGLCAHPRQHCYQLVTPSSRTACYCCPWPSRCGSTLGTTNYCSSECAAPPPS